MLNLRIDLPQINTGPFVFGNQQRQAGTPIPRDWRERIPAMFGPYFWHPFSDPHVELWEWINAITPTSNPQPFMTIWPRGRGKSTNAEAGMVDLGVRAVRQYGFYVSGTQDQADKHVATITNMLESDGVAKYAPEIGQPRLGKNGSRTWNRRMVTTATGFTVEAIGLNKAVRGGKIDWVRPDIIFFDDVDDKDDSEDTVQKKEEIITQSILPAGAANCAVLFAQNLIHADSIASRLAKQPGAPGAADYLTDRIVSGPFVAVEGLKFELQRVGDLFRWKVTEGRSLWAGFDLAVCEQEINRYGPTSFNRESQHDVDGDSPNALLTAEDFDRTRVLQAPDLGFVAVAVDPPGGATNCGIVAGGKTKIGNDWHGYTLEDATTEPGVKTEDWALAVLKCCYRHKADTVYVEVNYGGDMARNTIRQAKWVDDNGQVIIDGKNLTIEDVRATRGKLIRAEPVAIVFQQGRGHHVGQMQALEKEWRQWEPGDKDSPNRLDAEVWLYTGLDLITTSDAGMRQGAVRGRGGTSMMRSATRASR